MRHFYSENDLNSTEQGAETSDVKDFKKDALSHNCIHDVITEILPDISMRMFIFISQTMSTIVDEIFSFLKVI